MKKRVLFLFLMMLLLAPVVQAQIVPGVIGPNYSDSRRYAIDNRNDQRIDLVECLDKWTSDSENIHPDIDGYPFLVHGWGAGYIETKNMKYECSKINYSFYDQKIVYENDNQIQVLLYKDTVEQVLINDKILVFRDLPKKDITVPVELLVEGKINLLKNYSTRYEQGQEAKSSYSSRTNSKFVTKVELYCSLDNGPLVEIPTKKDAFIKMFPDKNAEIKDFISKNKINLKKEKDIIETFVYYNGLK